MALWIALSGFSAQAQTSPVVNYYGFLTSATGAPATGSYSMRFALFDGPTGGSPRWAETVTATVDNGNLAVELGKTPARK